MDANIDEMVSSTTAMKQKPKVFADHLSKIWRIDTETARQTIDKTTQHSKRVDNPKMSRNYSTGDRMLRYRRIKEYFFMDTLLITKTKGATST